MDDLEPGYDDGQMIWYADPHFTPRAQDGEELKGTFRRTSCNKMGFFPNNLCSECSSIPRLQSFRKRALLRHKRTVSGDRDIKKINNLHLNRQEILTKLKSQQNKIESLDTKLYFLSSKHSKLQVKTRNMKEKIVEFSRRGSMKAVCFQLNKAAEQGHLKNKAVLTDLLESVARNLHVEKEGKRYRGSFKMFIEVILMWGGPRLASFVAMNIGGPEIHSVFRWRKQNNTNITPGLSASNFINLRGIVSRAHERKDLPRLLVLLAEDETAIICAVEYCADKDTLNGFCGRIEPDHQCMQNCEILVGDGEEGYNNIMNAFRDYKIGAFARAIIANPLHPQIPKI